ncbi:head-tail adaptor protein [Pseudophaeobacter sp.]|jgi:head-tail adaptor|uniref:head-tail adaptor protein n=1 Tax=Pseudophaeobacter sp. TaxID=1971739 RepID=UPI0032D95A5B
MGGRLDTRIQFLSKAQVDDGMRREDVYQPHGQKVWASKEDASADEVFRAGQDAAHLVARFKVKKTAFTSSITAAHRLRSGAQEFEILGIKEVSGRGRILEITAVVKMQP